MALATAAPCSSLSLLVVLCLCVHVNAVGVYNVRTARKQPRSLLFPQTSPTRVQFIGGIGIPVEDLNFESVTSGYVLKAEYFLPYEANQFHQKIKPQRIHRRSPNATTSDRLEQDDVVRTIPFGNHFKGVTRKSSVYRWMVYRAIEMVLERASLPGRTCMLRSICEHAALPLGYESGLLAEILHILLTPSTSCDGATTDATKAAYFRAELLGRAGGDCGMAYGECPTSPIDSISAIFEI